MRSSRLAAFISSTLVAAGSFVFPAEAQTSSTTISLSSISSQFLGTPPFAVSVKSSSGVPVAVTSTTPSVCNAASILITLLSTGQCSLNATSSGTAASPVTQSFTVKQAGGPLGLHASAAGPVTVGSNPAAIVVADFNNDGIPDFATANSADDTVSVLLGNGSGGFTPAVGSPYPVGSWPSLVVAGDFNGDGITDLATANTYDSTITVLLGTGAGAFTEAPDSPFSVGTGTETEPFSLAIGDFNADGIQDIVSADGDGSTVTVLLGDGAGGFIIADGSPFTIGSNPWFITVGDFNGDGIPDLATANFSGNSVSLLLGIGSGQFSPAPGSPFALDAQGTSNTFPVSIVAGDFNGDGILDIATANTGTGSVMVLLGNTSGTLTPAAGSPFPTGSGPTSITAGDFNGDGITDVVTANATSGNLTLLLGNGSGGFTEASISPITLGTDAVFVAAADFNGDGILDLATANSSTGTVSVLISGGATPQTITFSSLSNVVVGAAPFTISATASSGLTVTFSSNTASVCTVSGATVTTLAAGTCSITATQAGNSTYAGATSVSQSFTVSAAPSSPSSPGGGGVSTGSPGSGGSGSGGSGAGSSGSGAGGGGGPAPSTSFALTLSRNPEIALGSGIATALLATGGVPPYTWSATGLPSGVSLNVQTGVLSGVPASPGNTTFTVEVEDSEQFAATANISTTLQVLGITGSGSLPDGAIGAAYSTSFAAAGGSGSYTFAITNPPTGLSLQGAALSGTPASIGNFTFIVQVSDGSGVTASSTFTLNVTGSSSTPLTVSGGALPSGTAGTPYLQGLIAAGGIPPYRWNLIGGSLPPGLTLDSASGLIFGTTSAVRTSTFTAQATDNTSATVSAVFTLTVAARPLVLTGLPFSGGFAGAGYPAQVLSGSGGSAPYSFAVTDGSLPPGLTLANGQLSGIPTTTGVYNFSITMTDAESPAQTITTPTQITVSSLDSASLIASAGSLSFSLAVGSSAVPSPASITVQSSDTQRSLIYSATANPAVSWLDVSTSGVTPGTITVALDPSALDLTASSSPFTTSLVISCFSGSACTGQTITIPVTLTVTVQPPQLNFTQNLVSFTTSAGSTTALSQTVPLANSGGGSSPITSITAADPWLTILNQPTTVLSGPPVNLTFIANPSGLSAGYHITTVTLQSSAGTITLPVIILVSQSPVLTLSTSGAQFQSTDGSSFQIGVIGGETVSWTAAVAPGAPWLTINGPASGSATATNPATLSYNVDASTLTAGGAYYGTIQITAPGVIESPLNYQVVLNISQAGFLSPSGLVFTTVAGAGAPASQAIDINSTYSASPSAAWIDVSPASGTSSTISVTPGSLPAGIYTGTVTYQFPAGPVQSVNVTMIIESVPSPSHGCEPTKLVPTFTGLANNFSLTATWPVSISVTVFDDCGNRVQNASAVTTFSNNDPSLALSGVAPGVFAGTWTSGGVSGQVTATVTATSPSGLSSGTAAVTGAVLPGAAPQLTPGGTLHIYNEQIGSAIPPGTIVEIYGSNLSAAPVLASTIPLPATLGGTSVTIGGYPAPLYYVSPGQIDAELPGELTPGNSYQMIVTSGGAQSTPQAVQITAAAPSIATFASGLVIAQHNDGSGVTDTSPAKPGEPLSLYAIGLGATSNPVADGAAASANPLSGVTITPTLSIDGETVMPSFAGLTPGFVALYQINFEVPVDAPNGDLLLLVSQNGATSNSAILPVHN